MSLRCTHCGAEFSRTAAWQRYKQRTTPGALDFCSRACASASPALRRVWSERRRAFWRNPGERERAAARRIAQMARGIAPSVSGVEDAVAAALARLGVPYRRQVEVREPTRGRALACVDFLLERGRVLEVFGSFWHCDPRKYPEGPIADVQRRTMRGDRRKHRAFERLGIPFEIIWELDVRDGALAATEAALERLTVDGPAWLAARLTG